MKKLNRRELLRLIALVAIVWLVVLLVVARWQRGRGRTGPGEPQLIHYPGTEGLQEQTSSNLGFRKYWFALNEGYPSKSVYRFYQSKLEPQGWRPLSRGEPQWVRRPAGDEARDLLEVIWVSPDNLFQLELQMISVVNAVRQEGKVVGEEREPGIQVYVTLRRALSPEIITQPRGEGAEPGGIEPSNTGAR